MAVFSQFQLRKAPSGNGNSMALLALLAARFLSPWNLWESSAPASVAQCLPLRRLNYLQLGYRRRSGSSRVTYYGTFSVTHFQTINSVPFGTRNHWGRNNSEDITASARGYIVHYPATERVEEQRHVDVDSSWIERVGGNQG